ncbi:MAG: lipoyl synthase [Leptospira sp.]|nr:lipoyl synthase [Leptospira sp.]
MNPLKKKPRTKMYSATPEKPEWLRIPLKFPVETNAVQKVRADLQEKKLHTVCESASCPNLNHCWSRRTATYMLGGDTCTRKCAYCDVASGKPSPLDPSEPENVAQSVKTLGLKHVVITAVNRDDLEDGGAMHFSETVASIRKLMPECKIELLIPDLRGKKDSLALIFKVKPDIINHNIETVESLFSLVAPQKNYRISLSVLKEISTNGFIAKSGIMLGLGETVNEVKACLDELKNSGVSMVTIGQYLQPTSTHYPVKEYVRPSVFLELKQFAYSIGFAHAEAGPLVRSSYYADRQAEKLM